MPLYVRVSRGATAYDDTLVDADFLNMLGVPIVEITGTIDGSSSIAVGDGTITTIKLENATSDENGVTNGKLAWMAAETLKGNDLEESAPPQDLSVADVRSMLQVTADGATLEHYDDGDPAVGKLRVRAGGITGPQLAAGAVTSPKISALPGDAVTAATANLTVAEKLTFNCEPATNDNLTYTLVLAAADEGKSFMVRVKSKGSPQALTFVAGGVATAIKWRSSTTQPPLSTEPDHTDLFVFVMIDNVIYGAAAQNFPD